MLICGSTYSLASRSHSSGHCAARRTDGHLAEAYSIEHEPAPGGTYVEGIVGSPQYVNPLLCQYNDADRDLCALVFSGLLRLDEHGQLQYDLADNYEVSPDGLVYTFRLRPNARWHDNRPVTADDVLYTISCCKIPVSWLAGCGRRCGAPSKQKRSTV
jgi:ABC-type transport system substrate-binding protein